MKSEFLKPLTIIVLGVLWGLIGKIKIVELLLRLIDRACLSFISVSNLKLKTAGLQSRPCVTMRMSYSNKDRKITFPASAYRGGLVKSHFG